MFIHHLLEETCLKPGALTTQLGKQVFVQFSPALTSCCEERQEEEETSALKVLV